MTPGNFVYGILLIIVAVLAILYCRASQRLSRYRKVHDETLRPVCRVQLDSFQLISCNPSFASLLGYSNPAECIALFPEYAHLRGQGFDGLCSMARDLKQSVVAIELADRNGEIVALEAELFVAEGADFMEIRPRTDERTGEMVNIGQSLIPCIEADTRLIIISCNQAARELFHWENAPIAGRYLGALLYPAEARARLESIHLRRMARKGKSRLRHLTLIGDDEYAECQWELVMQPEVNRIFAFCVDIRDRQLSRLLLESLSEQEYFVWEMDTRTREIEADPSWLKGLGYSDTRSARSPEFWESILDPDDRDQITRAFERFMAGEEPMFRACYRVASGAGVEHLIESSAIARTMDERGRPRRVIGLNRDVTEDAHEDNVIDRRHDLANHLASVTGYAGLISNSEALPAQLADYVREISKAGYRARALIEDNPVGESCASGGEIDEVARDFGIRVAGDRAAVVPKVIDSGELRAIVEPLCRNAVESGSDVDSITIETRRHRSDGGTACSGCRDFGTGDFFVLQVRDRGRGIAPENLPWVLSRGFSTRRVDGRDNALAALNRRLHDLGGHLLVESKPSKGTTVTVYLPYPGTPKLTTPGERGHVLIIDDQESVARYLQEVLGQEGYQVTAITDANEALSVFHENPAQFDLVITDQTMPGISGDLVMQSMHGARPGLPVILCTGYSETIGERAARELGACGYLAKPVDTDRLLGLIHESLQP